MFDDTVIKNNDNPARYNDTNKLLWNSGNKSNVTSLGEGKNGLFAFNRTVKNSIKYMYLNNNSFSDVNALQDFSGIIELQLQCNLNLSNIDGLSNHKELSVLTLHNCKLSSIGSYNEDTENYLGGLTSCSSLSKLSLQNNSNLNSLVGIESSLNLVYLIVNNCNISDIRSLTNHENIAYLNLSSNVNLVDVNYIKYCKCLQYIYLDNNEKMNTETVNEALNSYVDETNSKVLISQCVNS